MFPGRLGPSEAEPSRGRTPGTVPEEQKEQDARVSSPAHSSNTRLGEFHSFGSQVLLSFFCVLHLDHYLLHK